MGVDNIPAEVLKNDSAIMFLFVLFNICFDNGTIPSIWGKCIINPIPKSSMTDPRDPLSYRGISLASAMYKIYASILNARLTKWTEDNNVIADEQGGFRRKRSTVDQISAVVNLIETRKKLRQCTFAAFIDFHKAYDHIDRDKLWKRLNETGISGKMFGAIKSLYSAVSSCVRINSFKTDWFEVKTGLRQGCILSPLLFNLYINDLVIYLKSMNIGVCFNDETVCILLYADDVVLLAENAQDLQLLLNALNDWCNTNDMCINSTKSNIVHFRPASIRRTDVTFNCGDTILKVAEQYTYLGIVLSEHLDYNVTANAIA